MTGRSFYEDGSTLLTSGAFELLLDSELKRAIRSQNYLTLVVVEVRREWEGMSVTADDGTLQAVAQIIGRDIRDTDLRARTNDGTLALLLLDSNFDDSTKIVDRVVVGMKNHRFPTALRIDVGAACYPTHAADAEALNRQARARPLVSSRVPQEN